MTKTLDIMVSGRVQGVFYRQTTREKAGELGLKGKVMNLDDGNVRIIVTGDEEKLLPFVEWCKKGPPKALVTGIQVSEVPLQSFESFKIERH